MIDRHYTVVVNYYGRCMKTYNYSDISPVKAIVKELKKSELTECISVDYTTEEYSIPTNLIVFQKVARGWKKYGDWK